MGNEEPSSYDAGAASEPTPPAAVSVDKLDATVLLHFLAAAGTLVCLMLASLGSSGRREPHVYGEVEGHAIGFYPGRDYARLCPIGDLRVGLNASVHVPESAWRQCPTVPELSLACAAMAEHLNGPRGGLVWASIGSSMGVVITFFGAGAAAWWHAVRLKQGKSVPGWVPKLFGVLSIAAVPIAVVAPIAGAAVALRRLGRLLDIGCAEWPPGSILGAAAARIAAADGVAVATVTLRHLGDLTVRGRDAANGVIVVASLLAVPLLAAIAVHAHETRCWRDVGDPANLSNDPVSPDLPPASGDAGLAAAV